MVYIYLFKYLLFELFVVKIIWCYKSIKSKGALAACECLCLLVHSVQHLSLLHDVYSIWFSLYLNYINCHWKG